MTDTPEATVAAPAEAEVCLRCKLTLTDGDVLPENGQRPHVVIDGDADPPVTEGPYCLLCFRTAVGLPDLPEDFDRLVAWLLSRTPATARAKLATRVIERVQEDVQYPAIREAWENRSQKATLRDLAAATGTHVARVTWALGKHPRTDT